jgi:nucleotide-binding universal stress UspA family protein
MVTGKRSIYAAAGHASAAVGQADQTKVTERPMPHPRSGILVGVDGSPSSMAAVRWAAREATLRNAPLTLIHALATPVLGAPILVTHPAPLPPDSSEQLEQHAGHLLSDATKIAEDNAMGDRSPRIDTEVFASSPAAALVEQSKSAEMVVIGSRGQNTWRRALLGSVSTA